MKKLGKKAWGGLKGQTVQLLMVAVALSLVTSTQDIIGMFTHCLHF